LNKLHFVYSRRVPVTAGETLQIKCLAKVENAIRPYNMTP
jgi:hypothetical protein